MSRESFSLTGKVALVTGGAAGIGEACAVALAEAGARVMVSDIDSEGAAAAAERIRKGGYAADALGLDVCEEGQWADAVSTTLERLGGLDVLVNNAGVYQGGTLESNTLEQVRRVHQINVESVFLGTKYAVLAMKPDGAAGRGGSIINMSSVAGLVGVPGNTAYGSTKGAVRLYTKHSAAEFGALGYGVRVNSVHPGMIETAMGDQVFDDFVAVGLAESVDAAREYVLSLTALGRLGAARDVADSVVFLASDASSYITGAELVVDGGIAAK